MLQSLFRPVLRPIMMGVMSVTGSRRAWSPTDLTALAAWYDPSDLSTMFNDSAGTTPVATPGTVADSANPVGLILDKSDGLVLGPELVVNGDFSDGTIGWTTGGGATLVADTSVFPNGGGKLTSNGVGSLASITATGLVAGKSYLATVQVYLPATNSTDHCATLSPPGQHDSGARNVPDTAVQDLTYFFVAVTPTQEIAVSMVNPGVAWATPGDVVYIDNLTCKEVSGHHASQSTSTARPLLSARVNLLTYTEDFLHDAVSTYLTASPAETTGPFGDNDGWKFTEGVINSSHTTRSNTLYSFPAGQVLKRTGYFKQGSAGRNVQFGLTYGDDSFGGVIDFSSGTLVAGATGAGTAVAASVTLVNGWYECTVTGTMGALLTGAHPYDAMTDLTTYSNTNGPWYTGDGTSFVYAFGRDLRAASVASSIPPYQSVPGDGSTYDGNPTKFPYYLKFDGVDDYLSTAAIDLTGTDKVTVFSGSWVLSSTVAIFYETSTGALGGGAFYATSNEHATNIGTFLVSGTGAGGVKTLTGQPAHAVTTAQFSSVFTTAIDAAAANVNGVAQSMGVFYLGSSTGNFGNHPLFIGARSGGVAPFNGNLYSLIIGGALYDAATVIEAEAWVAEKTGVTL